MFKSRSVPACACCSHTTERFVCTCCEFFFNAAAKKLGNDLFKSRSVPILKTGQTHYKKYFHKSWREGVRHRAKRLFLGLPLARAVRLSYQRTYSLHEPRGLAIYSSPSLTEIVVLPKLRKKRDSQL